MAGHSHAANVAIRKGAQDKKRGKLFTKLAKQIIIASKLGGPDPDGNPRLRLAIRKARSQSMPKDRIERAIKKGSGNLEGENYEEFFMEGYGPGGVAVYCEVLTDNRNRAAGDIRYAFARSGGNLGTSGCVGYMFKRTGVIVASGDEDEVMMTALDAGADDVEALEDGNLEVLSEPTVTEQVAEALRAAGFEVASEAVLWVPDTRAAVAGDEATQLLTLIERLDDCDDIQQVHHNADIDPAAIEAFQNS